MTVHKAEEYEMKRYLSLIFVVFGILSVIISLQFDVRWNGIVGWGLAVIFLSFAIYFTKYIPSDTPQKEK